MMTSVCVGLIVTTVLHAAVVASLRRRGGHSAPDELPAVTWFRPLKPGVPRLEEKLKAFLDAIRDGDQVIFGVDPNSPERDLCMVLADSRKDWVTVVECVPSKAANPKISKLLQMAPAARHEHWIVLDAEALMTRTRADEFRAEWVASGKTVLTAGYRFEGAHSLPQQLDAMAAWMTLWPGLKLVEAFGRLGFTLGACTGVKAADVAKLGGWSALGDLLAEDHELGRRVTESGGTIGLSPMVLPLESDPMSWGEYWRHQVRVAVTYRAAAPLGALGMILTRGISAALLLVAVMPSVNSLLLLLLVWGTRVGLALHLARSLGIESRGAIWTVPIADVVESAAWARSWTVRRVWWGGRWREITFRGRLSA